MTAIRPCDYCERAIPVLSPKDLEAPYLFCAFCIMEGRMTVHGGPEGYEPSPAEKAWLLEQADSGE